MAWATSSPLTPRLEAKFALPGGDIEKISAILDVNNRRVRHEADETIVNSIYFDNCALGSCRETAAGLGRRYKLRLRWYGEVPARRSAWFEVKRRTGAVIAKQRHPVELAAPLADLGYRELVGALLAALPPESSELLRQRPEPTVLVRYRRRYYEARRSRGARLTLDRDIVGYDQQGARRLRFGFGAPIADRLVLEVKAPSSHDLDVRPLLEPLRPRQTRFSKYVLCCEALGLPMRGGS